MNKKVIVGALSAMAAIGIGFIPCRQQKTIHIQAGYFTTFQQISKPQNWGNWYPGLTAFTKRKSSGVNIRQEGKSFNINTADLQLHVRSINGISYEVKSTTKERSSVYSFLPLPDIKSGNTIISVEQWLPLARLLFGSFANTPAGMGLLHLKTYMEDAKLYYGFDIRKGMVTDSNVIVEKETVAAKNKAAEVARVQQELKDFISKSNLQIVQPVIADIRVAGPDSIRLMIGFPVNRMITAEGQIRFMHLPPHGHMLTGLYTGKYNGRQKLYLAMRSYITDHNLATPEDPYEKYLDNKIPASDTAYVHLQVNFPIY